MGGSTALIPAQAAVLSPSLAGNAGDKVEGSTVFGRWSHDAPCDRCLLNPLRSSLRLECRLGTAADRARGAAGPFGHEGRGDAEELPAYRPQRLQARAHYQPHA